MYFPLSKIRRTTLVLNLILIVVVLGSCRKFVEIDTPSTQIATADVFKSSASATAAQTTIYANMSSGIYYGITLPCALLSDELVNYSSPTSSNNFLYYTNSMAATQNLGIWTAGYPNIYAANSIIEQLKNNTSIPANVSKQLTGESKFVRALWFFYLTNQYGDLPLVLTTDYRINGPISRTPQSDVYNQIIADLKDADNLLNNNYVDLSDTTVTTERVRPNKAAAEALLARVYLFTKQYANAEALSTQVINNSLYKLCPNLSGSTNSVFLKNSSEAIWQLATPIPSSSATTDGQLLFLNAVPSTGTQRCTAINQFLLSAFEPNDKRFSQWVGLYTAPNRTKYYFPYKYQSHDISTSAASPTEYLMVLRLSEQYLIRAEAEAYQGKISNALADLNLIRNRAGLPNYAGAQDQASLLAAILHERQVELFTEWGHRWFDLIRTNTINSVMGSPGNVYSSKLGTPGSWNPQWQLFPVPSTEIIADPNLSQNPGY
ncbi:RagB/SusD family nutrient uptake outer membrane protein [Mucilaginibacter sp. AW1-3]